MKRTYKLLWILLIILIPVFPLSGLLYGVDVSDVGFSLNQYQFFFSDIDSIYLPLYLTDMIGAILLQFFTVTGIPAYLGFELAWVAACYYMCFMSYRLYQRYRNDSLVLPALAVAMLLAKCNFHFFIYNTTVAVMALTGLYFLIVAVNDKKPARLFLASAFFVLASLCKISALIQFAVFAVLFYDFYKKRNAKYFGMQILYCVLGFAGTFGIFALIMHRTCGIENYVQMVIDMFFYAGNSNDGHTIGNMVLINLKGTFRGVLLLAVITAFYLIVKRFPKIARLTSYAIPVIVILFTAVGFLGASQHPVFGRIFGVFTEYQNPLAILVALIYICMFLIVADKKGSEEFQVLAICAGILTVIMPIGSNVGITHICNEFFFALPFILIFVGERVRSKIPSVGKMLVVVVGLWCVAIIGYQSLYLTKAYQAAEQPLKRFSIPELKGMSYDTDKVDSLEEIVAAVKDNASETDSMIIAGSTPILHYLTGVRPVIAGCGGWIETDYVTAEEIREQLEAAETKPIVVIRNAVFEEQQLKHRTVIDFIEEHSYELVHQTAEYSVYIPQ